MNLQAFLADPIIQSSVLPFVVALIAAGFIRVIGGKSNGVRLASLAIGVGFLSAYMVIIGLPDLPTRGSGQKIFFLVAAGWGLGAFFTVFRIPRAFIYPALFSGLGAGLLWLAQPRLTADGWGGLGLDEWTFVLSLLFACVLAVHVRLYRASADASTATVVLMVASLAAGGIALLSSSASIAQALFVLAAALGGFVLWGFFVPRAHFGVAGLFAGGAAFSFLVAQMIFFTQVSRPALAVVLAVFFADILARKIISTPHGASNFLRLAVLGAACLVPAAVAVGVAYVLSGRIVL
jgi:hypothetical protein